MANRRVRSYAAPAERTVRASVSFPEDQYSELERIADHQRVSLAWVVREAVETYLVNREPLLRRVKDPSSSAGMNDGHETYEP